jgi:hypothetical protein
MQEYRSGNRIIHYINFPMKQNATVILYYFNDHFKLRSELSYNKTDLEHFGEWVAQKDYYAQDVTQ